MRSRNSRSRTPTGCDFVICEIGGTVGDIESLPFIESIRQLRNDLGRGNTVSVHTTLVPWIAAAGELKTKPTQQSVRELSSLGVQPEVLLCRCDRPLPEAEREKIALFCNVRKSAVIPALDARNIYDVPLQYHEAGLDDEVLDAFGIDDAPPPDLARWHEIMDRIDHYDSEVTIGVVGKYVGLPDAYKSLREALVHGGIANRAKVNIQWIDAELFEHPDSDIVAELEPLHGILVPGRLRRARQRGQDRQRQVRPRARNPVLRHLPRHADGLHRGGAEPGRDQRSLDDRIRRNAPSRWSA